MSTENYKMTKGRVYSIAVTVSGIADWTGLTAKMYIRKWGSTGEADLSLNGNIDEETDIVTFSVTAANSASLSAGNYNYEMVIYKSDKSIVNEPQDGNILIREPITEDPTA